jgi:glutaminase
MTHQRSSIGGNGQSTQDERQTATIEKSGLDNLIRKSYKLDSGTKPYSPFFPADTAVAITSDHDVGQPINTINSFLLWRQSMPIEARTDKHELQSVIEDLYGKYKPLAEGDLATYIPELGKADPETFAISVVSAEGHVFETGDVHVPFTIQSISKPFTFGMALQELGRERVHERVGVEPSGDAFNSIELQNGTNKPYNPMINTGAITTTALLHAQHRHDAFEHILRHFSAAAGRRLVMDESVYLSERRTGHRNRAIAYLLLNFGLLHEEAEQALDVYFKQCSILVTCRDLAVMAATLSNMGRNPLTGEQVFETPQVKDILSVMFTCGMYDYSGQWAYEVGVPAKSGVSGGVMAVVNRQMGIATYSPRIDKYGNSRRGIEVCVDMAAQFGLHTFNFTNVGSSFLDSIL